MNFILPMLLKTLRRVATAVTGGRAVADPVFPLEVEQKLGALHARAPVDRHLDVLFDGLNVGGEQFKALYGRCLERTGTAVTPFNVFQRFQTRATMLRYLDATWRLGGARAECGAYRGATALLFCHALRSRQPDFRGENFYLVDSFSGTSASVEQDLIPVRGNSGAVGMEPFFPAGRTDVTAEMVRGYFDEFPEAQVCAGWIPQVFADIPDQNWCFVHLDLTLYEPTRAALEYFYPRLSRGGVIICDGSIFCPGAEKAVDDFCTVEHIPYVVLGHREAVLTR
jgi:hypothetical protein